MKRKQDKKSEAAKANQKQRVVSPNTSDVDTADSDTSFCIESGDSNSGYNLKDHYYLSLFICFAGVISCYTGYAVL